MQGDVLLYNGFVTPSVKVFELVSGARIVGSSVPGAWVEAYLLSESREEGHKFVRRWRAKTDAAGRFVVVVPIPTRGELPPLPVRGLEAYRVVPAGSFVDGKFRVRQRRVHVTENEIQSGSVIEVGVLPELPLIEAPPSAPSPSD